MKKFFASMLAVLLVAALAGCSSSDAGDASQASQSEPQSQSESASAPQTVELPTLGDTTTAYTAPVLKQLETPAAGSPTVTLHTSKGDVKLVLYPEEAPLTVENFLTHAKDGYFDGLTFHRVINGFMAQGGDPTGTGTKGESIWGTRFQDEFSDNLHNYRGALSMANSGINTNGSQFFIVQSNTTVAEADVERWMLNMYLQEQKWIATTALQQAAANGASEEELDTLMNSLNEALGGLMEAGIPDNQLPRFESAAKAYMQTGGTPNLDYKHTVFGQVIEGMEVVDAICGVATDDADKPLEDVVIQSVTVGEV